jgi:hypothetical protein
MVIIMSNYVNLVLALLFINFFCSAHAEDITALVTGATSFHLTPAEKERFTEASDRFKKYEIPKKIEANAAYWLDNEHLVFSSRNYPGWQAKPDEMSRVITYNVNTGAIADSGYRGRVMCLNHLGDMLLAQSAKESHAEVRLTEYQWLAGKWGQSLEPTSNPRYSFIANHLCRLLPEGDPIFAVPPEKQPQGFSNVMPLLSEHGALETTVVRKKNGQIQDQLHLIKPDGERLLIGDLGLNRFYFTYLPWTEAYLETEVTPNIPRLISPSGEISSPIVPSLFKAWYMAIDGRATSYATRIGMLWGVQQHHHYWRKQGIFLQTNKGLLRIEVGRHGGPIKISPDGCMVQARVVRGDSFEAAPGSKTRVVINVCEEIEQ